MISERGGMSEKLHNGDLGNRAVHINDTTSCGQHAISNGITPIVRAQAMEEISVVGLVDCTNLTTIKENYKRSVVEKTAKFEWGGFTAGFVAGIAGVIVGHPFDTIKVRQQVMGVEYQSLWKCMKRTLKQEGMSGFYKGLLFPILTEGGRSCLFFGVYERLKIPEETGAHVSYQNIAMAGALGGAVQAIPGTPIELVKIKLQHQTEKKKMERQFRGPMHCMREIYSRHGFRACFRGIYPCILRDISGFSAYMTSYEYLCRRFHPDGPGHCSVSVLLLTGGIAGSISWLINLPMDYIKSHIQADSFTKPRYENSRACMKELLEQEGARVFYRGLPAVLTRAFVLNGVTLSVYSSCRRHFQNDNKNDSFESLSEFGNAPKFVPID